MAIDTCKVNRISRINTSFNVLSDSFVMMATKPNKFTVLTGFQDKYETLETLGQGTFGIVKKCRDKKTKDEFAVKIIKSRVINSRIENETQICAQLEHPHIVRLHYVYSDDMQYYMVFDLVTGGELFEDIVKREYYSESEASKCMHQILDAVAYCHDKNIIHRDIKPENLILTSHEEPKDIKLTDFGLAVDLNKDGKSIQKQMAGTPAYISPEIFLNMSYTKKGDIWASGILLYVLLLGFIPYPSNDTKEIKYLISAGKFDFFENEEWSDVTQEAINLVSSLLSYEPTDRITARQALKHPWISKREVPSKLHRTNTIDELKEYNKQVRKWKSLGHAVILTGRFKKMIVHKNDHSSIPEVIDEVPTVIPTLEKDVIPKGTVVSFTDGDLKHYESQFIVDVIAITQSITEAMHYNNTELYNQLSAPDCTNATVTESLRHKGERVMIMDPVVHMIGMKGACVTYKKRILFVGANSKFESVSYSETRVWKNFDGKWRCVHYHSS